VRSFREQEKGAASGPIPWFAYNKASENIAKGGQSYAVDAQARERAK
jgi:hypothetical protein